MNNMEQQMHGFRAELIAKGLECSEVREVEPGIYELRIEKKEDTNEQ